MEFQSRNTLTDMLSNGNRVLQFLDHIAPGAVAVENEPCFYKSKQDIRKVMITLQERRDADNYAIDEHVVFHLVTLDKALERTFFLTCRAVERSTFDAFMTTGFRVRETFKQCFQSGHTTQGHQSKQG